MAFWRTSCVTVKETEVDSTLQLRRTAEHRHRQDDDEKVDKVVDSNKRRSWPAEIGKNDDDDKVDEEEKTARSNDADTLDVHEDVDETLKELRQFSSRSNDDDDDETYGEREMDDNFAREYRFLGVDRTHLNDDDRGYGVERRSHRADFRRRQSQVNDDNNDDRIKIVYVGDDEYALRRRKHQKRKSRSVIMSPAAFADDSTMVDGCRSMPCRNDARCIANLSQSQGFICDCRIGFTGEFCQFVDFHVCMLVCWEFRTRSHAICRVAYLSIII